MPNYCSNHLLVKSASPEEIQSFIQSVQTNKKEGIEPFSLEKLCPMPKSLDIEESSAGQHAYDLLYGSQEKKEQLLKIRAIDKEFNMKLNERLAQLNTKEKELAQQIKDNKEKYGAASWYDWRIKNWGTKWDVDAEVSSQGENFIVYSFESAWSPPVAAIWEGSKNYPALKFDLSYYESGMDFVGYHSIQNGEVIETKEDRLSNREHTEIKFVYFSQEIEKPSHLTFHFNLECYEDPCDLKNNKKISGPLTITIASALDLYGYEAQEENAIWEKEFILKIDSRDFNTDFEDDYSLGQNLEALLTSESMKARLKILIQNQIKIEENSQSTPQKPKIKI